MTQAHPPIGSISNATISLDSEKGRQQLLIILNQLWQRTGGGDDDVGDAQRRELFPWNQGSAQSVESSVQALFSGFQFIDTPFFSVSANHTTAGNEIIEATASVTITLNQYPEDGEKVTVKRNTTAGNVTISGNGNNINDASTYTMALDFEGVDLVFSATSGVWLTV